MPITAVARKLVTIAYLMLKNNEPYRYAVAKRVHEKFTGLKFAATGKSGRLKSCDVPKDLPASCATHALPLVRGFDGLAAGERKMLEDRGLEAAVRLLQAQSATP